jgi:hypothetical protein
MSSAVQRRKGGLGMCGLLPIIVPTKKIGNLEKVPAGRSKLAKACGVHSIPSLTGQRKETEAVAPIHSYTVTQAVFHAGFRTKLTTLGGAAGSAACMLQFANDRVLIRSNIRKLPRA